MNTTAPTVDERPRSGFVKLSRVPCTAASFKLASGKSSTEITTQPGEWERSAESGAAGACAAISGVSRNKSTKLLTPERRRRGETLCLAASEGSLQICADERELWFEDGNDFDLLMENASHSDEIYGDTRICAADEGGCSVGPQLLWTRTKVGKRESIPGQKCFPPFGPLVVARVKNEVAGFLAEKIVVIFGVPDPPIHFLRAEKRQRTASTGALILDILGRTVDLNELKWRVHA